MNYIVSCNCCGHQTIIEVASPEEIGLAECPICQTEKALILVSSVEEMLPSSDEITEALSLDS